ncbi:hypothetical protein RQP46_004863 [Phenoliferia psychrophenolica]
MLSNLPVYRHPFSGAAKAAGRTLYHEKDATQRHSHASLPPAPLASDADADAEPVFPPDEERGRKFRPTVSAPALFAVSLADPDAARSTFIPAAPASDGEAEPDWIPGFAEDVSQAELTPSEEWEDDDAAAESARLSRIEADRQRRVWDESLQRALDEGKEVTEIVITQVTLNHPSSC